jgi:phosphate-selective porin OprO/OprP
MRSLRSFPLLLALAMAPALGAQDPGPVSLPGRYDGGYLIFRSADGAFEYWLDGRLQIDAAGYFGSENQLASGTEIRRARIGVKTTLFRVWETEIDVDFAENAVEIKDAWIGYVGMPNSIVRIGNFKEPFSLEVLTSSKNVTFMERSYADNLAPTRTIGASYTRWGRNWHVSGGVFGQEPGQVDETARDEGYALTGRATFAPVLADGRLVHVGVSLSRRTPDADEGSDTNSVRFRARPETFVSQARFLSTGRIRFVDHVSKYNAEAAMVFGPFSLQGEYTQAVVRRLEDRPEASFAGGYVQGSYFLTGESRKYLVDEGEFDRVIPAGRGGAWEVAARYSTLDLNDDDPEVDILGGMARNYTVGLTWYANTNIKWMLNYTWVDHDENAEPDLGPEPYVKGDSFSMLQTRLALAF